MRRLILSFAVLVACSSGPTNVPPDADAMCTRTIDAVVSDGHPDPAGAKAAKQARAGRIKDASIIKQPIDARQKARVGDFMIANEKIAAIIEDKGLSDGYARFGGEILALDRVGPDGLMLGQSRYGETLAGFAGEMINPESVGVLADGSDGKAAIVRVVGTLQTVPFLEAFKKALPPLGWRAALDYILEPGAEVLHLRTTLLNPTDEDRQLIGLGGAMHGFFHSSRGSLYTPEQGFGEPMDASWAAFESTEDTAFAWRAPDAKLKFNLNISGFQFFTGPEVDVGACQIATFPFADVIVGGPGLDGLREAIRRVDGLSPWRAVGGVVKDANGSLIQGATVSVLAGDGSLLTHAITNDKGQYTVHVPNETVSILATMRGYPSRPPTTLMGGETTVDLSFDPHGTITVHATEKGTQTKIPVRIQVIPEVPVPQTPAQLGILDELGGRLHQVFAISGDATLVVPPGKHRVIVTRGYEWEMLDTVVTVTSGSDVVVDAPLEHSVDTTGVMCADFHIHSFFSADSKDPVLYKVQGALADGLDIPVSSEHEWVIDFEPVIKSLGAEKWAFGMPSEELTTFAWGHFGVVPLYPKPDRVNNGAIEWIGKQPPAMFADVAMQQENPVLVVNHPRSGGSLGGLGAYFDAANFKPETVKGDDPLWSDQFEAIECFNNSDFEKNRNFVIQDWFAMLNAGKKRVCVGSSDSHHLRDSPVGYPRTCMYFGHDDTTKLTPEAVRDALRSGRSTVSGGIYLTAKGPGGEGPGQTLSAQGLVSFEVTASAPGWVDVDPNVEVIVDGKTTMTVPLVPVAVPVGKRFSATVPIDTTSKHWVVFHVKGKGDLSPLHPGRKAFAMSNPIFL